MNLALLLAFCLFCGLIARRAYSVFSKTLKNYRLSITQRFDEAEHLLKEAEHMFAQAQKEQESMTIQVKSIKDLAHTEVQFILQKHRTEIDLYKEGCAQIFHQNSRALRSQWEKEMLNALWTGMMRHAERDAATYTPREIISFLQGRLDNLKAPSCKE